MHEHPGSAIMTGSVEAPAESWVSREVRAMASAWERGEPVTARAVIDRYPGLDPEAALRLIYEETCLRRDAGEHVPTAEVVARYPTWGEQLRALFDCDRLVASPGGLARFPEVGERLGPFRLLAELGRGASGRTYLAADPALADRPVVVKVIPDHQDEHLALARLRHTHIVPLFSEHTFAERGLRGLCMPFLGGASLARILDDLAAVPPAQRSGKLLVRIIDRHNPAAASQPAADGPFRRGLEGASAVEAVAWIVACLADALHYAHARGLVHLDVKPSNVLITTDGQPMLLDFHLARGPILAGEWVADRLGGTPGAMSPEQERAIAAVAAGRPVPDGIDGRSDIYSLGLVLAQALGVPAGPGSRPRRQRPPGVSVGLADILQGCLAPDPARRYPDAASLAEDLRRELSDQPLRGVRNRSVRELGRKWRRRHPGAVAWAVAALGVTLAFGAAGAAAWSAYGQRIDRAEGLLEDARADRAHGRYAEAVAAAERGLRAADPLPATAALREALSRERRAAQRGELALALHALADRVRFRYGAELPPPSEARALIGACRGLWARRALLLQPEGLETEPERASRADLLELVAIWADLQLRLAPAGGEAEARRAALRLLDDAESACGPSLALEARRRQLGGGPGAPARAPATAWENAEAGRAALRDGRFAAAAESFRRALDAQPQDLWANFYLGLCCERLGQHHDAAAAFGACLALRPDAAICHYNRALAVDALGRAELARRGYARAIELDPHLVAARLNRGILSYKAGGYAEAIADFRAGLRAGPDPELQGRLYYNLALAQLAAGDRPSARASVDAALELGCREAAPLRDDLR